MNLSDYLEIAGAVLSVTGALLVTSLSARVRLMAFILWVVGDLLLIPLFIDKDLMALVAMQVTYVALSVLGIHTNTKALRKAP